MDDEMLTGWAESRVEGLRNITCRCCSHPLQRVVTDFGADHSFGRVPEKLKALWLVMSTQHEITIQKCTTINNL